MKEYFIGEIKNKTLNQENLVDDNSKEFLIKETIYNVEDINNENKIQNIEVYSDNHNLQIGDRVYIEKSQINDDIYYNIGEYVRYPALVITGVVFLFIVFLLFGKKAIKSIISLLLSLAVIFFILLPLTIKGYNPLMVSSIISIIMLSVIMYISHGINRITTSALFGSYISIVFTIIFSFFIINFGKITGNIDDISMNLILNTGDTINLTLLTISSIIIGVIGIVDDAAITQASVVRELKSANPSLPILEYYKRAMRVGANHAGAMINTLILAYLSSSLPLMLLFYSSNLPFWMTLNKEIVATEIIRSLIGSSGLLLAIPVTTIIAVYLVHKDDEYLGHICIQKNDQYAGVTEEEIKKIIDKKIQKLNI